MTAITARVAQSLLPLVAAVVAGVFGVVLLRRFVGRRRPYEGAWSAAMFMYAVASAAAFWGMWRGWDPATFRVYYLFGGILNVPYLFQGELYLLVRRPLAHAGLAALLALTAFATVALLAADARAEPLGQTLPLGREVFGAGTLPHRLAQWYTFPAYFLLLGGLVWSTWQMRGRPDLRPRVTGTLLIAVGATIVAIGSGVGAAFDVVPLFSLGIAAGIVVMFAGFLRATRPTAPAPV